MYWMEGMDCTAHQTRQWLCCTALPLPLLIGLCCTALHLGLLMQLCRAVLVALQHGEAVLACHEALPNCCIVCAHVPILQQGCRVALV